MSDQPKTCDLWLSDDCVLTVGVDMSLKGFAPHSSHHKVINDTIRDLACAVKPCVSAAEEDATSDATIALRSIEAIAAAIILLTQLSTAVQDALAPTSKEVSHE